MSANKYANLPDIDTAPDIYQTEDVYPSAKVNKEDSSDDEASVPTRARVKYGDPEEGVDFDSRISVDDASRMFKRAERRYDRSRPYYAYPPSPTSPTSPEHPQQAKIVPISHRLRILQQELSALETELADPSNPQLHKERVEDNVDPGELIRGLVDVRGRLDKIRKEKEGRGRLVNVVLGNGESTGGHGEDEKANKKEDDDKAHDSKHGKEPEVRNIVEMDRRVGELEKLVGSSTAALDETSPLPPPLLPMISRLNSQLTILTQPRHIDSISRRLKLLLSDLDRVSASQHRDHKRHPATVPASQIADQILPLLTRLGPSLPHIPHILTRLRTLSALHASAGEFQSTLEGLEEEQRKMHEALMELEGAVTTVEKSLDENRGLVRGNVSGLEGRVDALLRRLEELGRSSES